MKAYSNTETCPLIPRRVQDLFRFATGIHSAIGAVGYLQPAGTAAELLNAYLTLDLRLRNLARKDRDNPVNRKLAKTAENDVRSLLRRILKLNAVHYKAGLINDAQMYRLGINPPKATITQEPSPAFAPSLILVSQTRSFATLKLIQTTNRGSNTNTRLPVGVQNVQLLQKTINNGLHLIRSFTKPVVRVPLEHFPPGSDIVIAARYLGVRSEPGPISQSLTIHIPASPVVPS